MVLICVCGKKLLRLILILFEHFMSTDFMWVSPHPKVSLMLIDQDGNNHIVQTFKPSPCSSSFHRPKNDMNVASGCPQFAPLEVLQNTSYVKDDVMFIRCKCEDEDDEHDYPF